MWINQNFLLLTDYEVVGDLNTTFLSLRDNVEVTLRLESNGQMSVITHNMALAGDIVQSLATFLNLQELQVLCAVHSFQQYVASEHI
jgi:Bardet-Biedl syndrome 2 protein